MAQVLSNDVLPAIRSPEANIRRSAEAMLESNFSQDPNQVIVWLLDRLMSAADMPDRQMAAVLLGRRLPPVWKNLGPPQQKHITDVLLQVLQKETSRPVLVVAASALVSLAGAQRAAGQPSFAQDIITFVGTLFSSTGNADIHAEVGCIILSDMAQHKRELISGLDLNPLRSALQMVILNSAPSQLQLSAVNCLGHIGILPRETSLSLKSVAHLAQTLLRDSSNAPFKEDIIRSCFEALQAEQPPQNASLEVALMEISSSRQGADERTKSQAIQVLASAAKRLPTLFATAALRTCVEALCKLCRSVEDDDDSEFLADAARTGISTLAEYVVQQPQDSTVLALCWAFAGSVFAGSSEVDRASALRCLAAALVGIFRAAGKTQGVQPSMMQLPPNVASAQDLLMPFAISTADASAVVRRAATDGLSLLVAQAPSIHDAQVWAAVEDAIRKCLTNVAQDADKTVQTNVVRMVRSMALSEHSVQSPMQEQRLASLLSCMVPATVALAQRAVPAGFESGATSEADWLAAEDRIGVLAILAEVSGANFSPHAVETTTSLLRPLLSAPAVPLSVKLVALRALGPVLASTGLPTSSGPGAALLPFWKDGLQIASETMKSDEARSTCLGFYSALAKIFRGQQGSLASLQEDAATIVPLDQVVSAALSALGAPGATGEDGADCVKSVCAGAAAAILQGGPRTWARTQSHEEARYALFALQTCAVSNASSFLKVVPQILPVLMPKFVEAASSPIRLATLGLLEDMGKMVSSAMGLPSCSAQDSSLLQELFVGILQCIKASLVAEPRSGAVCHEGHHVLSNLKASGGKEVALVEQVLQGVEADKHDHDSEDDSDSDDAKDAKRINGHQIKKKGG